MEQQSPQSSLERRDVQTECCSFTSYYFTFSNRMSVLVSFPTPACLCFLFVASLPALVWLFICLLATRNKSSDFYKLGVQSLGRGTISWDWNSGSGSFFTLLLHCEKNQDFSLSINSLDNDYQNVSDTPSNALQSGSVVT